MKKNAAFEHINRLYEIFDSEIGELDRVGKQSGNVADVIIKIRCPLERRARNGRLLPFYYILNREYDIAWKILYYGNIAFIYENPAYHIFMKPELHAPVNWDMKPISYGLDKKGRGEDQYLFWSLGSTCFRLSVDMNTEIIDTSLQAENYSLSPDGRYTKKGYTKEYPLNPESIFTIARLMEINFRQEKTAEIEECLFRLHHIASRRTPSGLMEFPSPRMLTAWVNMYDYWYQARRELDPEKRKALGEQALYWFLETGLRFAGKPNFSYFVHPSDGCEIIGEFELMGDDQENYLRHLKRFSMHASISYCKKMMDNPIQIVPFEDRNMPSYDEFAQMMRDYYDKNRA